MTPSIKLLCPVTNVRCSNTPNCHEELGYCGLQRIDNVLKNIDPHIILSQIAENFEMRAKNIEEHKKRSHSANKEAWSLFRSEQATWEHAAAYVRAKIKELEG